MPRSRENLTELMRAKGLRMTHSGPLGSCTAPQLMHTKWMWNCEGRTS